MLLMPNQPPSSHLGDEDSSVNKDGCDGNEADDDDGGANDRSNN